MILNISCDIYVRKILWFSIYPKYREKFASRVQVWLIMVLISLFQLPITHYYIHVITKKLLIY